MNTDMNKRQRGRAVTCALAFGVLMVGGCDGGLTDVNENPNAPETVPVQNLLLGAIWDITGNSANRGAFGPFIQMYHGENWVQHLAQPIYNEEDKYTPRTGINENLWDETYFALNDLHVAKAQADDEGKDNIWAIAEIMSVWGFMILTDYFNDIPYREALSLLAEDAIAFPTYDPQSFIYPDLITRLGAAAARINVSAFVDFGGFDPIYQGDMASWLRFANSLQLRLAMRMADTPSAAAAQTAFVAAWGSTIFSSVSHAAVVDWQPAQPSANPVYQGIVLGGRSGDWRMSASLVDRLAAFNDPRLPIYADPALSDGQFRGLINGLVPGDYSPVLGASDFSLMGSAFFDPQAPSVLMSYAEMLFLGAEAAQRGWAVGATAAALYQDGITASMEEFGIDAADIATYLAQADVNYTTGTSTGLAAIYVQKWMALFMAGPEAFSEMRRVRWMDLTPAANSALPAGMFPERFNYPPDEALFNPDNYPGDFTIDTRVWWAN